MAKIIEYTYSKNQGFRKKNITVRENNDEYVIVHNKQQEYKHFYDKLSIDRLRKNMLGKVQINFNMIGADNPEEYLYVYFKNELSEDEEISLNSAFTIIYKNLEEITKLR